MENAQESNVLKKLFGLREASLALIIIAFAALLSFMAPGFLSAYNINTTLIGLSMDGILAVGMTLVLVVGGIDLSVGSVMAFANVLAGMTLVTLGLNIWLSVFISIILSVFIGFSISQFITKIHLSPFITTLSMMSIGRGMAYITVSYTHLTLPTIYSV